jgi:hypothetical protein
MDAITPWFMWYIMAVTFVGGKYFTTMRPSSEVIKLSWMRRDIYCLATTLLSVIILSLLGKPELTEHNACGTNFQKSPYQSMFLSCCNNGQKCSLLWYS